MRLDMPRIRTSKQLMHVLICVLSLSRPSRIPQRAVQVRSSSSWRVTCLGAGWPKKQRRRCAKLVKSSSPWLVPYLGAGWPKRRRCAKLARSSSPWRLPCLDDHLLVCSDSRKLTQMGRVFYSSSGEPS